MTDVIGNNYSPTFTQLGKELAYKLIRGAIKMQGDIIMIFLLDPKLITRLDLAIIL